MFKEIKNLLDKNSGVFYLLSGSFMVGIGRESFVLLLSLTALDWFKSDVVMSLFRATEILPNIFLAVVIGTLLDKLNTSRIMLHVLILLPMSVFLMGLGFALSINVGFIVVLSFIFMTLNYAYANARVIFTKRNFKSDSLLKVNAHFNIVALLIVLIGPILSGVLSSTKSLTLPFLFVGLCLLMGSALTLSILNQYKNDNHSEERMFLFKDILESFSRLYKNKTMWTLSWIAMMFNASEAMVNFSWIYTAKIIVHAHNIVVGLMFSVFACGGIAGSLLTKRFSKKMENFSGIKAFILFGIALSILASGALLIETNVPLLFLSCFLFGISAGIVAVNIWTARHFLTQASVMGSMAGATSTLFKLGMPVAIIISPFIVRFFGVMALYLFPTLLLMILGVLTVNFLKHDSLEGTHLV